MRVALVHPFMDVAGGAEKQILELAAGLGRRGHEVAIFTLNLDRKVCFPDLIDAVDIVSLDVRARPSYSRRYFLKSVLSGFLLARDLRHLSKKMSAWGPDIVNCHNYPSYFAAHLCRRFGGTPFLWMCNEAPSSHLRSSRMVGSFRQSLMRYLFDIPGRWMEHLSTQCIPRIVVLDHNIERDIISRYRQSPVIIRSGLDIGLFSPSGPKMKMPYEINLIYVGRIDQWKGLKTTVTAMAELVKSYPGIGLNIVGDHRYSPYTDELVAHARRHGLEGHVTFHGFLPDGEMAAALRSSDIFVFIPDFQPWGIVPFEAMLSGIPAIVSDRCGAAELIDSEVNGYVIPPLDPAALARTVRKILSDRASVEKVASAGMEMVKGRLSWEKYVGEMEGQLASVAAEKGPRKRNG